MTTVGHSCAKVAVIRHFKSSIDAATVICRAIVLWTSKEKDWEGKQQKRAKAKDLGTKAFSMVSIHASADQWALHRRQAPDCGCEFVPPFQPHKWTVNACVWGLTGI